MEFERANSISKPKPLNSEQADDQGHIRFNVGQTKHSSLNPSQHPETKSPLVQFEAIFVRNFVQSILPADDEGVFGTGYAGEQWRSLLAEEIATEIAASGLLGIAKMIGKTFASESS